MKTNYNVCITSGGTSEPIDTVRRITNTSTGRLGSKIADAFIEAGANVYYVYAKGSALPTLACRQYEVDTVGSVSEVLTLLFDSVSFDVMIHAMAISDYEVDTISSLEAMTASIQTLLAKTSKPSKEEIKQALRDSKEPTRSKISSSNKNLVLTLKQTPKVINQLKTKQPNVFLVGFKLLSNTNLESLKNAAFYQISQAGSDLVVANRLEDIHHNEHIAYFIDQTGLIHQAHTKEEIASSLVQILYKKSQESI
ncbi:phosphopantothenoylcysteine decarboxylase [Erysipelothrix rhusiopathiae]|nr:phosphopantothenoylcysteine decarboxylase [Erysipelothrix rhusiopathiae]